MMHVLPSLEQNRNKKLDLIHFLFVYSRFGHYHKNKCLLLVDFFATWCGPCKVLSPTVEALGKELAGQVRVLKIDVDKNEALATQLRIQSVPTLIIFKKGEIVWRSSGVMDHGSLLRKAQSYID